MVWILNFMTRLSYSSKHYHVNNSIYRRSVMYVPRPGYWRRQQQWTHYENHHTFIDTEFKSPKKLCRSLHCWINTMKIWKITLNNRCIDFFILNVHCVADLMTIYLNILNFHANYYIYHLYKHGFSIIFKSCEWRVPLKKFA